MKVTMQETKARTSDGRRVDTWSFSLPDGDTVKFDITLHSDASRSWFSAKTSHQDYKSISIQDPDINALKLLLTQKVEKVLDLIVKGDWEPSFLIELSQYTRASMTNFGLRGGNGHSLTLVIAPVEKNISIPVGNRGQTIVTEGNGPVSIVQRSYDDVYVAPKTMDDMGGLDSREYNICVSRVVVQKTEDTALAAKALEDCFYTFSQLLATRMAPQSVADLGIPTPNDLAALMASAAANPMNKVHNGNPDFE
jgi:hypothetical protein